MRRRKQPKEPYQTENKVARILDIPPSIFPDVFHLELSGNREAVMVGCDGILEYIEGSVAISTGKMGVRFSGDDLRIRNMNEGTIVIEGIIRTIAFEEIKSRS